MIQKNLTNIAIVCAWTLGSRILGVLRDALMLGILGTSPLSAAFLMAFTIPNLFRRLLGEGALSAAVIPVLTESVNQEAQEKNLLETSKFNYHSKSFDIINRLITRLCIGLCFLTVLFIILLKCIHWVPHLPERWYEASDLCIGLMPYMPCVCLAAIISACLNVYGYFKCAAIAQISLNVAMAGSLIIAYLFSIQNPYHIVNLLCLSILIAGVLQLIIPAIALKNLGWKFKINFNQHHALNKINKLFLKSALAAGIFQINLLVNRLLAFYIDDTSITFLYLASRLIELPLGLFTLAITTVIFPQLACLITQNDTNALNNTYSQALKLILAITIPASIGLIVLSNLIIKALFEWGAFNAQDTQSAVPILCLCALSIPFYSWATLSTRGLHAHQNTQTPAKITLWVFIVNLTSSSILMFFLQVKGLAIANLTTSIFQAICLHWALMKECPNLQLFNIKKPIFQLCAASILMGVLILTFNYLIINHFSTQKIILFIYLGILLALGVVLYIVFLWILKYQDLKTLLLNIPYLKK